MLYVHKLCTSGAHIGGNRYLQYTKVSSSPKNLFQFLLMVKNLQKSMVLCLKNERRDRVEAMREFYDWFKKENSFGQKQKIVAVERKQVDYNWVLHRKENSARCWTLQRSFLALLSLALSHLKNLVYLLLPFISSLGPQPLKELTVYIVMYDVLYYFFY